MLTDAVLVDRVIAGFDGAFDELYRRHANAAWRLGQAVTGNSHDAADAVSEAFARVLQAVKAGKLQNGDAFRSYLLTATRNAALDGLRKQGKAAPTDDEKLGELPTDAPSPADKAEGAVDAVLVAQAFRNLPERWRSVLWLTEVEGVATKDAADQLGLSANGTAQLAVRARAGLRERFLQAHVKSSGDVPTGCRFTVEHLGAYVGGGISPRDLAKVDQHLAGCEDCRARKEQLEELGTTLRRVALPIPLALGALSADRVRVALAASSTEGAAGFVAKATQLAKEPTPFMRKVAGSAAAGVLAIGLLSLGFVGETDGPVAGLAAPRGTVGSASVELPEATISDSYAFPTGSFTTGGAAFGSVPSGSGRTAFSGTPSATAPATPAEDPLAAKAPAAEQPPATKPEDASPLAPLCGLVSLLCPTGGDETAPPPALPEIPVNVGLNLGGHEVGVGLGLDASPTAGATVDDTDIIAPAPTPTDPGVQLQVGPVAVPVPLPDLGLDGLGF